MAGRRLYDREIKALVTSTLAERLERLRQQRNIRTGRADTASDIYRSALLAGCRVMEMAEKERSGG